MASLRILDVYQIAPATDSTESATGLSLPLTYFDARCFRFPPAGRAYFYKFASCPTLFHSQIIPTLKHTLSHALLHFLPLAGKLTWPPESASPIIVYTPNDAVSFAVAESCADFDRLTSRNEVCEAAELRALIPELLASDTDSTASIISLQITLFPNKGFCIGIAMNHTVLDGKSASMFLKAWAHICRNINNGEPISLSCDLTPSFDRTIIEDPDELVPFFLNQWQLMPGKESEHIKNNPRTIKPLPSLGGDANNLVRGALQLSREKIDELTRSIKSYHEQFQGIKDLRLSTLVVSFAYVSVCLVKSTGGDRNRKIYFLIPVDCRTRIDKIPTNYFGNCLHVLTFDEEAETLLQENGVAVMAKKLSDRLKGLETGSSVSRSVKEGHARMRSEEGQVQKIAIAGSPRFAYYEEDFGWGRPEKVEIVSIYRVNTLSISLVESKDGSGGLEIGLVLPKQELESFASLFMQM